MKPGLRIGVLGGTFDPVHFGHLRFAVEFRDALTRPGAEPRVHLIPCHIPPHRGAPQATPQQRLDMLHIAVGDCAGLSIDKRELNSDEPSYSVDTLISLRAEFPAAQLVLAVGMDAFASFTRWHRWQEILEQASLLVGTRPGHAAESDLLRERQVPVEQLTEAGQIAVLEMTPLDISSSGIRQRLRAQRSVEFLLPPQVGEYIAQNNLYR